MYANKSESYSPAASELALIGTCGYQIQNNRVVIDIAQIANQRDMGNLSGTLSVELWALKQPYTGFGFTGIALAGTTIGEIKGQHYLENCRYDLLYQEPPQGTWYFTLMLREWIGNAYTMRDYINFALPYLVTSNADVSSSQSDNVINVNFTEKKPITVSDEGVQTRRLENEKDQATVTATKVESPNTELSLNTASYQDILAVKGISKKLAENIIDKRPFKSFDEVKKIKGVGPKIMQKISEFFSL